DATGEDAVAVRGKGRVNDAIALAQNTIGRDGLVGVGQPEASRAVEAAGQNPAAIGTVLGAEHTVIMVERREDLPGARTGQIPNMGFVVGAGRDEAGAVAVETEIVDPFDMGKWTEQRFSCERFPNPGLVVGAAGGQTISAAAEGDGINLGGMLIEGGDDISRGQVPNPGQAIAAPGGHVAPIGTESDAADRSGVRQGHNQGSIASPREVTAVVTGNPHEGGVRAKSGPVYPGAATEWAGKKVTGNGIADLGLAAT